MEAGEDQYEFCPVCGDSFAVHPVEECDPLRVNDQQKPRFYRMDLHCYNNEFLQKIIVWQANRIQILEERLGLKKVG